MPSQAAEEQRKAEKPSQATEEQRKAEKSSQSVEVPTRRKFTAEYKADILRRADACEAGSGELGELLRKEGLYSSHLLTWRTQRERGALQGLEPKKRGRKAKRRDPLAVEVEHLRRENARLEQRLKQAETIIEVQKKVSQLLGLPSTPTPKDEHG